MIEGYRYWLTMAIFCYIYIAVGSLVLLNMDTLHIHAIGHSICYAYATHDQHCIETVSCTREQRLKRAPPRCIYHNPETLALSTPYYHAIAFFRNSAVGSMFTSGRRGKENVKRIIAKCFGVKGQIRRCWHRG
ncbi:hypothetical protein BDD12DRAFT_823781 [Trichophaea hybrida]|nr:hypothetical protein BDD12DRAFT_823781 [Trichophaea hybrida]